MLAFSQAEMTPLTEELATKKTTQTTDNKLEHHVALPRTCRYFIIDYMRWQGFLGKLGLFLLFLTLDPTIDCPDKQDRWSQQWHDDDGDPDRNLGEHAQD